MKKKIVALFALLVAMFSTNAMAQDYSLAVGVRGGGEMSGLTVKYNLNSVNSIEGIVNFMNGVNLTGLYEFNTPILDALDFYYGAGASVGAWDTVDGSSFSVGIDGVIGIEYVIPKIPLALSLDYKPFFNIIGDTGFRAADLGLGVKVTF